MKTRKVLKKIRANAKTALILFFMSLAVFAVAFAAYAYEYRDLSLPKTTLVGQEFASLTREAVKEKISQIEAQNKQNKIALVNADKKWDMTLESAGWKPRTDEMVNSIFDYGHSAKWYKNIWPLARTLVFGHKVEFTYEIDQKKIEDWVNSINDEIGTPKKEANLKIKGGEVQVIEPSAGKAINTAELSDLISKTMALESSNEIKLNLIDDQPIILKTEAEGQIEKAKQLVSESVELVGPKGSYDISASQLGAAIELKKEIKSKKGLFGTSIEYGPVYVSFNESKIRENLDKAAEQTDITPSDAKFNIIDGKVSILQTSTDGKVIKIDEAVKLVISELEKGQNKKIELPIKDNKAAISAQTASDIERYGIKELIGTGTTSFSGSTQSRIHNISMGVQYISGTLIKPGEEFSTIGHLGAIDGSSGYLQELVIKENQTIPEFGGGLCQVSTTLFRAVMNAGLEVTERHNHSYRVSYYEPPIGMDATIYSPKPDFKFKNDTTNYVLIQGKINGNKITFDVYGTKDGREVEITEPYVYDVTSPAEDIYIDDPSLAPGEVKRIDRAHPGAKAVFYYRVKKDGKVNETKFNSSYVPWPAKYLRGPQTDSQTASQ